MWPITIARWRMMVILNASQPITRDTKMTIKATKTVWNGERVLKVGQFRAIIVHRWFGFKTHKSNKKTWNETVVVSGPVDWVEKQWE